MRLCDLGFFVFSRERQADGKAEVCIDRPTFGRWEGVSPETNNSQASDPWCAQWFRMTGNDDQAGSRLHASVRRGCKPFQIA